MTTISERKTRLLMVAGACLPDVTKLLLEAPDGQDETMLLILDWLGLADCGTEDEP